MIDYECTGSFYAAENVGKNPDDFGGKVDRWLHCLLAT